MSRDPQLTEDNPRLGPALKYSRERLELDEVIELVRLNRQRLLNLTQQVGTVLMNIRDEQVNQAKWRFRKRNEIHRIERNIKELQVALHQKDALIARLEHAAEIGRLLNSHHTLESLAKAWLDKDEWEMIQRRRTAKQRELLSRRLRYAAKKKKRTEEAAAASGEVNGGPATQM